MKWEPYLLKKQKLWLLGEEEVGQVVFVSLETFQVERQQ